MSRRFRKIKVWGKCDRIYFGRLWLCFSIFPPLIAAISVFRIHHTSLMPVAGNRIPHEPINEQTEWKLEAIDEKNALDTRLLIKNASLACVGERANLINYEVLRRLAKLRKPWIKEIPTAHISSPRNSFFIQNSFPHSTLPTLRPLLY